MTVTLCSIVLDADDFGDIIICVRRPSLAEDTAVLEETLILGDRCYITPCKIFRIMTGVDVSLDPSVDVRITGGASEDYFATDDADDSCDISGLNVVEDDRGLGPSGGIGNSVEDGGIAHDRVDDSNSSNAANTNFESNLRVADGDSLEVPSPVPSHFDSGIGTIDSKVSDGELLVSDVEADVSTIDYEVAHETNTKTRFRTRLGQVERG